MFLLLFLPIFVLADSSEILEDTNIIYLKMEEASSPMLDSNPNEIDAACTNCPNFEQTGIIEYAGHYDGTNDELQFDANTELDFGSDVFTFNAWFKSDNYAQLNNLFGQWDNAPYIQVFKNSAGKLSMNIYTSSGSKLYAESGNDYTNNGWNMVTFVRETSTRLSIYLNATNITVSSTQTGATQVIDEDRWYVASIGDGNFEWDGLIDEFSVYDKALNQTEITYLYNSGEPGVSQQYPFPPSAVNITNITCTSPDPDDTTEPYTTDDTTPSFTFNTTIDANCSISDENSTYTTCGTTGSTSHDCTLPVGDALNIGTDYVYLNCSDQNSEDTEELEMYILCSENNDCNANQFCNLTQECQSDLSNGADCGNISYVSNMTEDDGVCINDCDNDGLGLTDDFHCFAPHNIRFDSEEPTYCESDAFSFNSPFSDEREPLVLLDFCHQAGETYYEDRVSSICLLEDDTSVFECNDPYCSCDEEDCDGLTEDSELTQCDLGFTYFADACNSTAGAKDRNDSICRSSNFDSSCTADSQCNGVVAGTGNCNATCGYEETASEGGVSCAECLNLSVNCSTIYSNTSQGRLLQLFLCENYINTIPSIDDDIKMVGTIIAQVMLIVFLIFVGVMNVRQYKEHDMNRVTFWLAFICFSLAIIEVMLTLGIVYVEEVGGSISDILYINLWSVGFVSFLVSMAALTRIMFGLMDLTEQQEKIKEW